VRDNPIVRVRPGHESLAVRGTGEVLHGAADFGERDSVDLLDKRILPEGVGKELHHRGSVRERHLRGGELLGVHVVGHPHRVGGSWKVPVRKLRVRGDRHRDDVRRMDVLRAPVKRPLAVGPSVIERRTPFDTQ